MEEGRQKKQKTLRTRLRDCFGKPSLPQSHVPLDIWKHILQTADIQSMGKMAQTSKAFEEVVREKIRTNNWELALRYRKEGQIRLAKWCLKSCVKHGHPHATFHLGYAHINAGWGVNVHQNTKAKKYMERAIELGSEHALVLGTRIGHQQIQSTNPLVLAYMHLFGKDGSSALGLQYLEQAAQNGDEFAQHQMGKQLQYGYITDKDIKKALDWYTKSAEQGYACAQYSLCCYYTNKGNEKLREKWWNRYSAQRIKIKE